MNSRVRIVERKTMRLDSCRSHHGGVTCSVRLAGGAGGRRRPNGAGTRGRARGARAIVSTAAAARGGGDEYAAIGGRAPEGVGQRERRRSVWGVRRIALATRTRTGRGTRPA